MTAENTFTDEPRRRSIEDIRSEALHHALHWASQQEGGASPEKISATAMEFEAYLKAPAVNSDGWPAGGWPAGQDGWISARDAANLLHQYSEWLDADARLMRALEADARTHDDLVKQFISSRSEYAIPALEETIPRP